MTIIDVARSFVGIHEEANNSFDPNTPFGKLIKEAGHKDGESWCSYASEVIAKKAYPEKFNQFDILFSAGAVATFNSFKRAGYEISNTPKEGWLVVWQKWVWDKIKCRPVEHWQGHVGICTVNVDDVRFHSVEGNTSDVGSREGTVIREQTNRSIERKPLDAVNRTSALYVLGFVNLESNV
jgi:hypothetical protein